MDTETNVDSAQGDTAADTTDTATTQQTIDSVEKTQESAIPDSTEETNKQPDGAPETYSDFTVPENFTAPIEDFKSWAKEQNLTQEAAQSMVDFYTNKVAPMQQAQHEAQVTAWAKESTEKYGKEGIESANKALSRFSSPEFNEFLQTTGFGNHPGMIGIFHEISSKISESNFIDSKTTDSKPKTLGQVMYPDMK